MHAIETPLRAGYAYLESNRRQMHRHDTGIRISSDNMSEQYAIVVCRPARWRNSAD